MPLLTLCQWWVLQGSENGSGDRGRYERRQEELKGRVYGVRESREKTWEHVRNREGEGRKDPGVTAAATRFVSSAEGLEQKSSLSYLGL